MTQPNDAIVERVAIAVREARFGYEGRETPVPQEDDYVIAQAALEAAGSVEREAVVKWLRSPSGKGSEEGVDYADAFADAIERGDHWPAFSDGGDGNG